MTPTQWEGLGRDPQILPEEEPPCSKFGEWAPGWAVSSGRDHPSTPWPVHLPSPRREGTPATIPDLLTGPFLVPKLMTLVSEHVIARQEGLTIHTLEMIEGRWYHWAQVFALLCYSRDDRVNITSQYSNHQSQPSLQHTPLDKWQSATANHMPGKPDTLSQHASAKPDKLSQHA